MKRRQRITNRNRMSWRDMSAAVAREAERERAAKKRQRDNVMVDLIFWSHGDPSVGIPGGSAEVFCSLPTDDAEYVKDFLQAQADLFAKFWDERRAYWEISRVHDQDLLPPRAECPTGCAATTRNGEHCHCQSCGESGIGLTMDGYCEKCAHADEHGGKACRFGCRDCAERLEALYESLGDQ